jgi:uncharacterized protein YciI
MSVSRRELVLKQKPRRFADIKPRPLTSFRPHCYNASVKVLLLILFAASACLASADTWLVFLVKGDAPRTRQEDLQQMQKEHIENFQRLFGLKKLITAGPLQDPTTIRRGIVVLTVATEQEVHESFLPDPYIQSGIMKVQPLRWRINPNSINTELPDPNAIQENRLALLSILRQPPAYLLKQHEAYVAEKLHAAVGGWTHDSQNQILLFPGTDADLSVRLQTSPLVRHGFASLEFMPLWMAKGALRS